MEKQLSFPGMGKMAECFETAHFMRKPNEFIHCWSDYSEDSSDDTDRLEAYGKESYNDFQGLADKPCVYALARLRADDFSSPPVVNLPPAYRGELNALLCWTGLRYIYIVYSDSAFCIRDRLNEEIMKVEVFDDSHWNDVKDRLLLNML